MNNCVPNWSRKAIYRPKSIHGTVLLVECYKCTRSCTAARQTSPTRKCDMKIGINALFFQYPATGSGQYMTHLLSALAQIDSQNEYVLLGSQPVETSLTAFPYHVQPVPDFVAKNENISKVMWEQFTGPDAAQKHGVDVFHVPYFAPPLF